MVTPAGDLSLNPNIKTPGDVSRNFAAMSNGDLSRNNNYYHD
jgi:hypothetical protein